ncbi:ABC transporter permease subunit, partial [candidate division KSB1 bacterium]|nr:ABC transporter permease subunit [candidate division KSB1 bacterium]
MTKIWAISLRELRSYFVSPVAYGIIAAFSIITGYFFYVSLSFFLDNSTRIIMEAQMSQQLPPPVNVNTEVVRPLFDNIAFISIFMIAMITMRLFAEEKKMMTIELLFTSPITNFQTIMGKFLAGYLLYCTMLLPTVVYFIILVIFGNPE